MPKPARSTQPRRGRYLWAMRLVILLVFLVLIGLLAALNMDFLLAPHTLNLGFATYPDLPAGLLLLTLMLLPLLIFYFWAGLTRLRAEADSAKLLRDLDSLRVSLDSQEGSRFAQLQTHLDQRLNELGQPSGGSSADLAALNAKIDALGRDVRLELAQMDDYLKARLGR